MTSWYESALDRQIREAQERGEFDNLPGAGKPIPGVRGPEDENWWVKDYMRREQLTFVGPTSLQVRKEADELMDTVAKLRREAGVRELVAELNVRIRQVQRGGVDGPPVVVKTFDVDAVVVAWRALRK